MLHLSTQQLNQIPEKLYKQFSVLSNEVKQEFRKKGFVIPTITKNGIRLGKFLVSKNNNGLYQITDNRGEVWYDNVNLPQSAILIANDLELRKFARNEIINLDQRYGYAVFEYELHKRGIANLKNKDLDLYSIRAIKQIEHHTRKKQYKNEIINRFKKLCYLV